MYMYVYETHQATVLWSSAVVHNALCMYSSDIIKSNKRQISKSNISKTAVIVEKCFLKKM